MSDVTVSVVESTTSVTVSGDVVDISVVESPVTVSTGTSGPQGASYNQGDPIYVTVRNSTGSTLAKGTIVYTSGAAGNHTLVQKALATGDATSARTLGWVSADIANNADGLVVVEGYLDGINTDHIAEGSQLYLSPTVAGSFTATKPSAPDHMVYVGVVTKSNPGNGRVLVKVQNGYELEELHDVQIISPVNNQVLTYDSATDLWKNATNPADGVTSITAASPLTGGTITSTGSIGLDQTALSITQSQVTNLVSDLTGKANLAGGNAFTEAQTITGSVASNKVLEVKGASGQSASFFEVLANAGNTLFRVNATGYGMTPLGFISGGTTMATNARNTLYTAAAASIGLVIQGAASQTADLLQLQDSAASVLFNVTSSGTLSNTGNTNTLGQMRVGTSTSLGQLSVVSASAGTVGAVVRGASGQTADILQLQTNTGTVLASVNSGGAIIATNGVRTNAIGNLTTSNNSRVQTSNTGTIIDTAVASNVVAIVRGAASQTANLQEWQNSAGTVLARIASTGQLLAPSIVGTAFQITSGGVFSNGSTSAPANVQAYFLTTSATNIGAVIRGAASQTANLQEWQNSAGTVLARITSAGLIFGQAADATVATASTGVGYMGLPQNTTTTGSYTIVAADAGEHIYASATRTVTIPANSALALPIGTTLTFIAGAGATMTIAITTDTMYLAGAGTTGSRTLAAHGIATAVKTTATTWIISGNGLT